MSPVRCSHVGLCGLGSGKAGYSGYEEQRNGWILNTFLKLFVPPAYVIWENVQTRELGTFNAYWLYLLPATSLGSLPKSSHNSPQCKGLTSSEPKYLTPCPSCLNMTVHSNYRVRWCGIDRLDSCSSITGFLMTKKRPCAFWTSQTPGSPPKSRCL